MSGIECCSSRQMGSDAIKLNGGGRRMKSVHDASEYSKRRKVSVAFASTAHLQAATFDIWLRELPFAKLSQHTSKFMFCLCYWFRSHFSCFCSPVTGTTLAWEYLNLLFRCLVERELTGLWGYRLPFLGPAQQVSNKHLFWLRNNSSPGSAIHRINLPKRLEPVLVIETPLTWVFQNNPPPRKAYGNVKVHAADGGCWQTPSALGSNCVRTLRVVYPVVSFIQFRLSWRPFNRHEGLDNSLEALPKRFRPKSDFISEGTTPVEGSRNKIQYCLMRESDWLAANTP